MATVTGTAGPDVIHAEGDGAVIPPGFNDVTGVTDLGDSIVGGVGADIVYAGEGDDTLVGGQGADTLYGGKGNDVFLIQDTTAINGLAEMIDGGGGANRIVLVLSGGAYDLSQADVRNVNNLALFGDGGTTVTLSAEQVGDFETINLGISNLIVTTAINARLVADRLITDSIVLSDQDDNLIIEGDLPPSFALSAGGGADRIRVIDVWQAEESRQTINGGDGDDVLVIRNARGDLDGGNGNDQLDGGRDVDTLSGGFGDDTLRGGGGQDFYGLGPTGGADLVRIEQVKHSTVLAPDYLIDFRPFTGDLLDLSRIDADLHTPGDQAFVFAVGFTGVAGQLVQTVTGPYFTYIQADVDGDGTADLRVNFSFGLSGGGSPLPEDAFIL